jgi:hypothetical protein
MLHLSYFIVFLLFFSALPSSAQKKWDGEGGNEQWSDPLNWTNNSLPSTTDDVILDNSVVSGNYRVILPTTAVAVRTILIDPSGNNNIQLDLSNENAVIPALTITGPGYGLTINKGGIFKNSSGASSGTPLIVSDSIKINNDGRFIINTARGHATNVDRLSRAPGTEEGIVEFDIPDASTTISLSGRVYGKLILRSVAWGNTLNYTAAGTSKVLIRSDLEIEEGVNFNLNFSDTIFIRGDLKQDRSTLNLGNTTRSVVLAIQGDIMQLATGIITETGIGKQQLLLNGDNEQQLKIDGQILNEVAFVKNGTGSARLMSHLSLPYQLTLKSGVIISSSSAMLMLLPECSIIADSLSTTTYIDGPLRKMGLSNGNFLFPVGKRNQLRWIQLKDATGDFTVEYVHSDPSNISHMLGGGISHISGIEYWNVSGDNSAAAVVKLSFIHPNSGGVTQLSSLRVARLENGVWKNAGNTDFGGAAGSNGWVSSFAAGGFSAENNFFALASAISQENPLPITAIKFTINRAQERIFFNWQIDQDYHAAGFELQESVDNTRYNTIYRCSADPGRINYQYGLKDTISTIKYYRVKAVGDNDSEENLSKTVKLMPEQKQLYSMNTLHVRNHLNLRISLMEHKKLDMLLYNTAGQVLKKMKMNVQKGTTTLKISVAELPAGAYFLVILNGYTRLFTSKFIKGS